MKRLVLCCDGTWNTADQSHDGEPCPTNVIRLACRVAKRDGETLQVVYYDQGVGTGNLVDRWTGGAFGRGLEENIHDAYRFLIANYELGDEIFLFGFSRGAFTARSLAGMIRNCGILKRTSVQRYPEALALYRDRATQPDDGAGRRFRAAHSLASDRPIPIRFIGVWDTVGALGIPLRGLRWLTRRKYQFHDTELSGSVQTACHALAIDERRAPFKPALWRASPKPGQNIEQVWFPGVHSDVGGGYPDGTLSDISLDWMIRQAAAAGLVFDVEMAAALPIPSPNPLGKLHNSKRGLYRVAFGIDRIRGFIETHGHDGQLQSLEDATQRIDDSALNRWESEPTYRPKSLREYFRRKESR